MKSFKSIKATFAGLLIGTAGAVGAADVAIDDLLRQVQQGRASDNAENQRRIAEFQSNRARQRQLLQQAQAQKATEEQRSRTLEATFDVNDGQIGELEVALDERLGDLKELFGVVQQAAGDARGEFSTSLTHLQFPERIAFLDDLAKKLGQTSELASIEDMEKLWYELLREINESGKVVSFPSSVTTSAGTVETQDVTRVGVFNIVSDGKYLDFLEDTGALIELPRQPQARFLDKVSDLEGASSGFTSFGLDPSRGQLLGALIKSPTLRERIDQGGPVGRIIIVVGIVAVLIAIWRLIVLTGVSARVGAQMRKPDQPGNNPLGRVLQVYQDNPNADVETLELKLGEQILKETPKLNRWTALLKIVAVVAPLMGLLGTVTGMIVTFQQITLFGTGDPQVMAGGISQALVTTVLGLCVAIPTVLLHTFVSSRAKRLTQILQEEAAGMVAQTASKGH